jgi:nitrite reductase/ring-hydroxylating ferredoxin subunit
VLELQEEDKGPRRHDEHDENKSLEPLPFVVSIVPSWFRKCRMAEFQTIAKVGEIPDGEGRAFPVDGTIVAVFNLGGEYTAINDVCPHMGASLAGGYVEGTSVTCPWHAWRFSVKDGTWLDNPRSKIANACYPVRVVGEEIQVLMKDEGGRMKDEG